MSRNRKTDKHLPRCVYHKHGAYWLVKKGKWERLGDSLHDALAEYAQRFKTHTKGSMPELIETVLNLICPKLALNTQKQYRQVGEKLKIFLAEFNPNEVLPKHVAAIQVHMEKTPNLSNRAISVLKIVFMHGLKMQKCDINPCVGIGRYKENKRTRRITDEEYADIQAVAPERLQIIMDLLYLTGQRISDVLKIKRLDIDEGGLFIEQKKTKVRLSVQLSPDLRKTIEQALALNANESVATLLRNRKGKAPDYSTTKIQWNTACKKAGVKDAHMHDLRAKALTDAEIQGAEIKELKELAGHSSESMTYRYLRLLKITKVNGPKFN
jgi:integrase